MPVTYTFCATHCLVPPVLVWCENQLSGRQAGRQAWAVGHGMGEEYACLAMAALPLPHYPCFTCACTHCCMLVSSNTQEHHLSSSLLTAYLPFSSFLSLSLFPCLPFLPCLKQAHTQWWWWWRWWWAGTLASACACCLHCCDLVAMKKRKLPLPCLWLICLAATGTLTWHAASSLLLSVLSKPAAAASLGLGHVPCQPVSQGRLWLLTLYRHGTPLAAPLLLSLSRLPPSCGSVMPACLLGGGTCQYYV